MAVFAPIPRASAETAAIVNPGLLMKRCSACLTSFHKSPIGKLRDGVKRKSAFRLAPLEAGRKRLDIQKTRRSRETLTTPSCFVMVTHPGAPGLPYWRPGMYACLRTEKTLRTHRFPSSPRGKDGRPRLPVWK